MQGIKEAERERILSLDKALREVDNDASTKGYQLSLAVRVIYDIAEAKHEGKTASEYDRNVLDIPNLAKTTAVKSERNTIS